VPACQSPPADTSAFTTTPPLTSEPAANTSSSTGTTSSSGSGTEASTTAGELSTTSTVSESSSTTLILDVGADTDLGDGKPIGCKGKIDFLFVISRYAGMGWFQVQLLDAFPKFIATIQTKFSDFDYHIMVVDGDPSWGSPKCDAKCPVQCVAGYPCGYMSSQCDTAMGAGVVFSAGYDAANKLCPIDDGRRYMVKGQTDLEATFACAAQVGSSGDARMGEALAVTVQPWMNEPGSCNDGFLRDDALLMVTLITNTYDVEGGTIDSQQGDPETWMDAVRKAKHNDLNSVVALGLIPTQGPGCAEQDRICQMLELVPYALNRDMWADDYGPFFDEATDLVATACADFIPPG